MKLAGDQEPTFFIPSHYNDVDSRRSEDLFGTVEDVLADRIVKD